MLIDADARAAKTAAIVRIPFWKMFHPASYPGTGRAWRAGHRIGGSGKRVDQLGSTFVVGPGPTLLYEHRDAHSADHAPLSEVLAALRVGSSAFAHRRRSHGTARRQGGVHHGRGIGIGFATALRFAREGAIVVGLDLAECPDWKQVADAAPAAGFHVADVRDAAAQDAAVAATWSSTAGSTCS